MRRTSSRVPHPAGRRRRSRGFTVAEVLVQSTLLVLLLGIAYAGLVLSHRYFAESEASVSVQQQAVVALKQIGAEMGGTPSDGYRADSDGLVFVSPQDAAGAVHYDTSGAVQWQRVVAYYLSNGILYRKERSLTPGSALPDPFPTPASVRDDGSLEARVVARGVSSFQATSGSPLGLAITTVSDDFGGSSMQLTGAVGFRSAAGGGP